MCVSCFKNSYLLYLIMHFIHLMFVFELLFYIFSIVFVLFVFGFCFLFFFVFYFLYFEQKFRHQYYLAYINNYTSLANRYMFFLYCGNVDLDLLRSSLIHKSFFYIYSFKLNAYKRRLD